MSRGPILTIQAPGKECPRPFHHLLPPFKEQRDPLCREDIVRLHKPGNPSLLLGAVPNMKVDMMPIRYFISEELTDIPLLRIDSFKKL